MPPTPDLPILRRLESRLPDTLATMLHQLGIKINIDHVDTDFITDQLSKRCEQIITKMAITA